MSDTKEKYLVHEDTAVIIVYNSDGTLANVELFADRQEAIESLNNG